MYKFKMLMLGAPGTEKTELIREICQNSFHRNYKMTIGCDIFTMDLYVEGGDDQMTISIWDIANQERFSFFRKTFYYGSIGALIMFDLTRNSSFELAKKTVGDVLQAAGKIPIALYGVKADRICSLDVDPEEIENFLQETPNCKYFKDDDLDSMDNTFSYIASKMMKKINKSEINPERIKNTINAYKGFKHEISVEEILEGLGVTQIENNIYIFREKYYFRIPISSGQVYIHHPRTKKFARICLEPTSRGWSNTSLNSFKLELLSKIAAIAWDELPTDIYPQIEDFLFRNKKGPNIFYN